MAEASEAAWVAVGLATAATAMELSAAAATGEAVAATEVAATARVAVEGPPGAHELSHQ